MNDYIYSAGKNAFFPVSLKAAYLKSDSWPADGVEVSDDIAQEFMGSPPTGKMRAAGNDGYPAWAEIPPPTHEDLVAAAERETQSLIAQANDYMNNKQWPGKAAIGRLKGDELTQYGLWLDYLDALDAVDTATAPDIAWPEKPE